MNIIKKDRLITEEEMLMKYIEAITHSGLPSLDDDLLGKIKRTCKKTPDCIGKVYFAILTQLKKNHSEIRLSAFQLIVVLFKRAHKFRQLVVNNLETILELCTDINPEKPLPLPKPAAAKLKELALSTVHQWKIEFGPTYKQFLVCYNYLNRCKNVNFEEMQRQAAAAEADRARKEAEVARAKQKIFDDFVQDFNEKLPDIQHTIESFLNCISLLLPPPEDFFLPSKGNEIDSVMDETNDDSQPDDEEAIANDNYDPEYNMRLFGINPSYNLVINIDTDKKIKVARTTENSAIIDNLIDNTRLIKKRHLPVIKKWNDSIDKSGIESDYTSKVKDVKEKLERCLTKQKEFRIEGVDVNDSDSDDDMEEVVKEGYEPDALPILQQPRTSQEMKPSTSKCTEIIQKPKEMEISEDNEKGENASESSSQEENLSRKQRLLALAPKLPYDVDLYHWEDETLKAPTLISMKMGNPKFWGCGDAGEVDEMEDPAGVAALRTRVIEYTGEFQPVTKSCRAPLPSGKLCPRMDRIRCPFHGKIVARDETGKVVGCLSEDEPTPSTSKAKSDDEEPVPDWQDPELLAQLKAATGIDLKMPDKKKKGKRGRKRGKKTKKVPETGNGAEIDKTRFPGLTNIRKHKNNPKLRLKKKIFNKSALRRVAQAIDKIERRKHRDKFGDQFNYAYS